MNDEHAGLGGTYLLDPKTGKRTLVERTFDPNEAQPEVLTDAPAPEPQAPPAGEN